MAYSASIQLTLNSLGTFDPDGDSFSEASPDRRRPIRFAQDISRDLYGRLRRRTAPTRSKTGFVGARSRSF